jgi:signal transduction histidine kinase
MTTMLRLLRDAGVPLALAALAAGEVTSSYGTEPRGLRAAMLLVLAAMCLALSWRRRRPGTVAVVVCALAAVFVLALQPDLTAQPPIAPFLAVVVALFALGAQTGNRTFWPAAIACATVLVALETVLVLAGRGVGDVVPSLLFWSAACVVGRLLHLSRREAAVERQRAQLAEEERDLHVQQAAVAERTRIARELHDVVAHSLSVIVIQSSVEARLLEGRDDSTAQKLHAIERTGRAALVELRRLLGLLRTDEDAGTLLQPLPSLREVDAVLDGLRRAGHDVRLEVHGDAEDVPAGVDVSAYRIVQEAVTNVLKHAPGSPVRVVVDYRADAVAVEVENDRSLAAPAGLDGSGLGLVGMRERVRVYGGSLHAGARSEGGFEVRATFPSVVEQA